MALRELAISFVLGAGSAAPAAIASQPDTFDVAGTYVRVAAEAPCPIDPRDLAAIQGVESPSAVVDESGLVSNLDGSPVRGDGGHSSGAFQFYELAGTWARYGEGGDPDRLPDAAAATARMLCANNYHEDRRAAIKRHNGSGPAADAYAARVIAAADGMPPITAPPAAPVAEACETEPGRGLGQVAGRAWCNLIVEPWLSVGARSEGTAWGRIDGWVFGNDTSSPAASGPPATPGPAGQLVSVAPCSRPAGCQLDASWAPSVEAALRDSPIKMTIISANRTNGEQSAIYVRNCPTPDCPGGLAARPGTSNHEGGFAVDLARADTGEGLQPGDGAWEWLSEHGARYQMLQSSSITAVDSVHWSRTGN